MKLLKTWKLQASRIFQV